MYLCVDREFPGTDHHTIVLARDYHRNLDDISPRKIASDDVSVYIRNSVVTAPSAAPAGHSALYILARACGTSMVQLQGHLRRSGRCHGDEGRAGTSSIRQRAGVRRQRLTEMAGQTRAKTLYIEPGSPWENGYCESFNFKLRDEFLNGEIFYSIKELRVLAERWRVHYNTVRPHSSLGYRPPAPEAWLTNNMGCGEVETATRFPLLHTPDGGYLNSEIAALH